MIHTQHDEALILLMEECAEVSQACAKILRFGPHESWNGMPTNTERLENEIGDVLAIIDILVSQNLIDPVKLDEYKTKKMTKLLQWSSVLDIKNSA